jgi:hypothetical protein
MSLPEWRPWLLIHSAAVVVGDWLYINGGEFWTIVNGSGHYYYRESDSPFGCA